MARGLMYFLDNWNSDNREAFWGALERIINFILHGH